MGNRQGDADGRDDVCRINRGSQWESVSQAFTQHQTPRTSQQTQRRSEAVVSGQRSGEERSFFRRTPRPSYEPKLHWCSFR
ncbi:hypothetical protein QQF64_005935 [Cirrhinus molitorella]|uniref:Uncharacterized protein n=1 Tax=Cirrhinus molitorella TaxID=172907 RepID=A0ABR3MDR6_9TELE